MEVVVSVIGIAVVVVLGAASWILTRLTADITRLSTEVRDLREDNKLVRAGFDSLRSDTRAGLDSLRSDTQAGFDSLRSDTQAGLDSLRSDTQAGLDSLRSETQAGLDSLRSETQAGFDSLRSELRQFRGEVGQLRDEVHGLDVRLARLPEQADA